MEDPKAPKTPEQKQLMEVRKEIQRPLEGRKKENMRSYADHILSGGETPSIILASLASLPVETLPVPGDDIGIQHVQIPYGMQLVAADGDTQTAALYAAMVERPAIADDTIRIDIYHGRDLDFFRQLFHDLNNKGVRPSTVLGLGMDGRDPVVRICREIEKLPFLTGRLNKKSRQLKKKGGEQIITLTALHTAVRTLLLGKPGIGRKDALSMDSTEERRNSELACLWFGSVFDAIGAAMEDRECLASGPAVLPAIGAVGHQLLSLDPAQLKLEAARLALELKSVDWRRGQHWAGIAGRWDTDRGTLSTAGAKEACHAVLTALTDSSSSAYRAIRHQ
jgi:DNA sulfur modification protein DndB